MRQLPGYDRIDNPQAVAAIDDLYDSWCDLQNFFLSSVKLLEKQREGSKIHRRYEPPTTPCQRLVDSPAVTPEKRQQLKAYFRTLNPFPLKLDSIASFAGSSSSIHPLAHETVLCRPFRPFHPFRLLLTLQRVPHPVG